MRPVFKYIFCGLILAALIFISLCVFYIANTYALSTKNSSKPIFPPYTASYFANISTSEIREIEDTPPEPLMDGETDSGSSGGLLPHFEPSETEPEQDESYVQEEQAQEPDQIDGIEEIQAVSSLDYEYEITALLAQQFNESDYTKESWQNYQSERESVLIIVSFGVYDQNILDTLKSAIDGLELLPEDSPENESYTEIDLLYSILETMKINQIISLFVLAVSLIIIIFKPIDKHFF